MGFRKTLNKTKQTKNSTKVDKTTLSKLGTWLENKVLVLLNSFPDLSVAFFLVLSDLFWHKTHHWYAGNAACKIVRYLAIVATYSSNYAIVALSLDRCHSVARPMQSYSRGTDSHQSLDGLFENDCGLCAQFFHNHL